MKDRTKLILGWGAAISLATSGVTGCVISEEHIEGSQDCYDTATHWAEDVDVGPKVKQVGKDGFMSRTDCGNLDAWIDDAVTKRADFARHTAFEKAMK